MLKKMVLLCICVVAFTGCSGEEDDTTNNSTGDDVGVSDADISDADASSDADADADASEDCDDIGDVCVCEPNCEEGFCGDDGCGGTCGCDNGYVCEDEICEIDDHCVVDPDSCECMMESCPAGNLPVGICGVLSPDCFEAITADFDATACASCDEVEFPGIHAMCEEPACAGDIGAVDDILGEPVCTCYRSDACIDGECTDTCGFGTDRGHFCPCSAGSNQCASGNCLEVEHDGTTERICTVQCNSDADCPSYSSGCNFSVTVMSNTVNYCTP